MMLYEQDESVVETVSPDTAGFFELSLSTSALSKVHSNNVFTVCYLPTYG